MQRYIKRVEVFFSAFQIYVFLWKKDVNESNENQLSNYRVQPILYKNSVNESNESSLSNCRMQPILYKKFVYLHRKDYLCTHQNACIQAFRAFSSVG